MTLETDSKEFLRTDIVEPDNRELSLGAGIAIVGVCLVAAFLIVFLCILNYTNILVNSADTLKANDGHNVDAFSFLLILAVTLSPGFGACWITKMIVNKGL